MAADPGQYNPPLTLRSHIWRMTLALLISGLFWSAAALVEWREARVLFWVDLGLGLLSFGLVLLRRRYPLTIAVLLSVFGVVSVSAAGPGSLAVVSLATRRVVWQLVLVGTINLAAGQVFPVVLPEMPSESWWVTLAFGLVAAVALIAWGMYVGSRRELLWTLRDQVARARSEQELRVEQGRATERARIAREMHDVLAHRITLITMHAGALTYRTDLSPEQLRETAGLIQTTSHEALTDLRQVLGVLRGDDPELRTRPQPTFREIGALILEAETSGMSIRYDEDVDRPGELSDQTGRTAYRIVQEGLTNARKHAPGATVLVAVTGRPDSGLTIRVRNPARSADGSPAPQSGLGLVGLDERAKLAGGRVEGGRRAGGFELTGWLPWAT